MKVETKWNLGNFTVGLGAEVAPAVYDRLASLGLRFLGQRNTEVDKILGGFESVGGKMKRKVGFKRGDVGFEKELAQALAKSFEELELPLADGEEKALTVAVEAEVTECLKEAAALKFRDAKEIVGQKESAGTLEDWLLAKGYGVKDANGDLLTHGEDGEYSVEMLRFVHGVWTAHVAAQKKGI